MPSETLSYGPGRSYASLVEAVLQALEASARGWSAAGVDLDTRIDALEIDDLDLMDIVETVAEELGERGLAVVDGSEISECETVGDLVAVLARAAGVEDIHSPR